ncbi:MAG: AraC family transcriptional regulator, partial [Bacteroidota bacterium]
MELGQNLLFFFAALGAFNAFLLAGYLLFKTRQFPLSFLFLGFLLMCYAIRSGVSCLYFFDNIPRELIKTGLSAHLLAGPSLYYF